MNPKNSNPDFTGERHIFHYTFLFDAYEETIENVIKGWYPLLNGKAETSRLVVADSGSTDKTHMILAKLQENYSKLEILSDTGKQHGPKLMRLYDYAIKKEADYIFAR